MNMKNLFYQVAGHRFRLSFQVTWTRRVGKLRAFPAKGGEDLFHLTVVQKINESRDYEPVGHDNDIASIGVSKSAMGRYLLK